MNRSLVANDESDLGRVSRLLLGINAFGLVWLLTSAVTGAGPWSAWGCTASATAIYLWRIRWREPDPLKNLAIFGLSAGLAALAADWWLVSRTQTLVYPDWGPFLAHSPGYMPVSWAGLILTIGFLGWRLGQLRGRLVGIVTAGLLSGTVIPLFELGAHMAGWWSYRNCLMIEFVPLEIILGEILIGLPLPWLAGRVLERRSSMAWALHGLVAGGWIWLSYAIARLVVLAG